MNSNLRIAKLDEQIVEIETKMKDPHLCDGTADTYSRISGYYRPVSMWNTGKKEEMQQRVEYSMDDALTDFRIGQIIQRGQTN